ncbi:MAG: thiamine-phosphate kinase [Rhodospirillaceae bacterium]|nr:thiamine-phosphate kinase [Rhodospirillaceae bacterium]
MRRGEFDLIAKLFTPLTGGDDRALGLMDDSAVIPQKRGFDTVVSTDTLVEGIHFLKIEPADVIARRLLRVNLSDLAAMGAVPFAYFLNLTIPAGIDDNWLEKFAAGLQADQEEFGLNLLGGDTTKTTGPVTLSVTICGEAPAGRAVCRGNACPGDLVFVSGTIGDAGLGLPRLRAGKVDDDILVRRYQIPEPRVELGTLLRDLATAMADVSDGLLADLGHICTASATGATLELAAIPVSDAARAVIGDNEPDLLSLLTSGDDYELVFTAPPERASAVLAVADKTATPVHEIGRLQSGPAIVTVRTGDGREIIPETTGYRHF